MLVLGDAHADDPEKRAALRRAYAASDADVALQVGDLLWYDPPVETSFIAGNNEDFDVVEALRAGEEPPPDAAVGEIHLLASDVVEIEGLRVAGLSGNFAPTRFDKRRTDLQGDRRRHFVRSDVEAAKDLSDVDVFLTHEAPHGVLVQEDYDVGCKHVDDILRALEPVLCLVGHHHEFTEARFGRTRVVSLAPAWERYYHLDPATMALESQETPAPDAE
ncbi:MAG: metallophosphoesterase [Haloarculaceae archaeon]